eukprot:EG_transcript_3804
MKKVRRREREDPKNTWNMQFMAACKVGNKEELEVLLEKGAQLDHTVKEGEAGAEVVNTPFTNRVRARDLAMIRWLAEKGADVNVRMENGLTALHHAVLFEAPDVITAVMAYNPDTTLRDPEGHTPVELAFARRKLELAQLLLRLGAVHDFRDRRGGQYTATQQACITGDMALLETLFELGESVHQRDTQGNSLLHLATQHEQYGVVEELLGRRANINATNAEGASVLFQLLAREKAEGISFFCSRGADVNARSPTGTPLLQQAVINGQRDLALLLLQLNARPSDTDALGNVALHWAASGRHINVLELLLDAKAVGDPKAQDSSVAEVNTQNAEGDTPLHKASRWGRPEFVSLLLSKDADPTLRNNQGRTPIHACALMGHVEAALQLLTYTYTPHAHQEKKKPAKKGKKDEAAEAEQNGRKVEVDAEDAEGRTPLQVAVAADRGAMVGLLLQHGATVHRPSARHGTLIYAAVAEGKEGIVRQLIAANAHVDAVDPAGRPLLHAAVQGSFLPLVELLVAAGTPKDAQDPQGATALHVACAIPDPAIARVLVGTAGVHVNLRDAARRTPLHVAARSGAEDIAALLVESGGEVDAEEMHQRTPLHVACEFRRPAVVAALLSRSASIEARDHNGWSPLHMAVFSGCAQSTRLLIDAGAALNEPDNEHRTPLILASQAGQVDCGRLLVHHFRVRRQSAGFPPQPAAAVPPAAPATAGLRPTTTGSLGSLVQALTQPAPGPWGWDRDSGGSVAPSAVPSVA